ncbi:unnamed protein product [Mytilus edulis]|uniref:Uncharacterized protein n=1 Tax=Mytilus edulis TaxID=6550 RepID=A0A8S3S9S6_MYTED|nr:unnamed protein product [Mytilus edulis]
MQDSLHDTLQSTTSNLNSDMDTNKFVLLVLLTILEQTFAEPPWCRMLVDKKDSHRKYCYEEGTYRVCKTSCLSIVLDQSFVANDCPWGDAPQARGCQKINNLTSGRFCIRKRGSTLLTEDVVIGINCCGTCMSSNLKQSVDKLSGFRSKFPEIYKKRSG